MLTVGEAAIEALKQLSRPASLEEVVDVINSQKLFEFRSNDHKHIVRSAIKKMQIDADSAPEYLVYRTGSNKFELLSKQTYVEVPRKERKIFISHSSKDKDYVEDLIDLVRAMGIARNQIFCTSISGYGADLGENFMHRIKGELDDQVTVIFVLSSNFYASAMCVSEVGASWIKAHSLYPILVPEFEFSQIQDPLKMEQAIKMNDPYQLNQLRNSISRDFSLDLGSDSTEWERNRDRFIKRITRG